MEIKQAEFLTSSAKPTQCPNPDKPEYAFIGRSNVGKSSLINMLCDRNSLAKTSSTPGKTQLINHFVINSDWYLVDLPGYGYAKVSKTQRKTFKLLIDGYLRHRSNLMCLFILVDIRHKPQKVDIEFMYQMGEWGVPFVVVFTKADKLKPGEVEKNVTEYKNALLQDWEELPDFFISSATKNQGKDEILSFIEQVNQNW
ncbi:ribosome biogenesis GTP-binding protein YihA/YsxC [Plebeiibacterium marinum]|uniref:Probable GTP-binding protein EngB n=1 Tax=Plebeiibacterium marinum TaxID=2992111 RepID=A0AAE3MEU5_9BACT|nr:ribosome biogenesis GTP-binding protein YihA/YsxC [Plebeiobacterium marinum]MCW3806518.1 ribosome biogenesis GTP-binding protein YihA/YsxC [Plebeiobacterium marinum]